MNLLGSDAMFFLLQLSSVWQYKRRVKEQRPCPNSTASQRFGMYELSIIKIGFYSYFFNSRMCLVGFENHTYIDINLLLLFNTQCLFIFPSSHLKPSKGFSSFSLFFMLMLDWDGIELSIN